MSYSIRFEDRKEYLYVHVEGQDSLETSISYWQEVSRQAEADGFKKILIEEDLEGQLTDLDIYQLTSDFLEMGLGKFLIGFVDIREENTNRIRFGELVATNRGIRGKIFETVDEAEAWLLRQ